MSGPAATFRLAIERGLVAAGLALLAGATIARISGELARRDDLRVFDEARQAGHDLAAPAADTTLWSAGRIRAFRESEGARVSSILAVLAYPRLGLEVPVRDGTDELTLNRGAGRIAGTAAPGEEGNIGIAGHRDGYFRALKDARTGDALELRLRDRIDRYRVTSIEIVAPEDVGVLAPGPESSVTLVTCYPFYFVGPAPHRFVVRARREPNR